MLMRAFRQTFLETEHGQIVLAHLADYCGWNKIAAVGTDHATLADFNARRACFGVIFHFLEMTPEEQKALNEAARREQLANREGQI